MKKIRIMSLGGLLVLAVVLGLWFFLSRGEAEVEPKSSIRIGLLLYRGEDTFIGTMREAIEEKAKAYELETGIKVSLDIMDAKGSQMTQNDQVERLISLGCDALCVNTVDRYAASVIIDQAMEADIPIVFFNREPVEEDMNRWEHLYYVGTDPKESAVLQGQILVDAYRENPSALDLDGDGTVSYVLLEGESSHQDSLIRTEWSIQTLKDGGVPLEKLTGGIANWERSQASALTEQWLEEYAGRIELVICNNDDMALGAIDAMDRADMKPGEIPVVGIDGTPAGQEAVQNGKLFGTVEVDREAYAQAVFGLASDLSVGKEPSGTVELVDGKYYWAKYQVLTR